MLESDARSVCPNTTYLGYQEELTLDLLSIKDGPFGVKGLNNHPRISQSTDIKYLSVH